MKEIPLTRGQTAIVDDADFAHLAWWKWYANRIAHSFYAVRKEHIGGRQRSILMHRQIMGLVPGEKRLVDHRNHNTLDNRRENLRICTQAQNLWNMQKRSSNTSGHTGIIWDKRQKKWVARFRFNKNRIHIGTFNSIEDAVVAYRKRSRELRGEFNYPEVM